MPRLLRANGHQAWPRIGFARDRCLASEQEGPVLLYEHDDGSFEELSESIKEFLEEYEESDDEDDDDDE